jgi:hypothetical protein
VVRGGVEVFVGCTSLGCFCRIAHMNQTTLSLSVWLIRVLVWDVLLSSKDCNNEGLSYGPWSLGVYTRNEEAKTES